MKAMFAAHEQENFANKWNDTVLQHAHHGVLVAQRGQPAAGVVDLGGLDVRLHNSTG
jgi:hypothetical protein